MRKLKSKPTVVSPQFREWTRGTSFVLAMGKTQVAALVTLHYSQDELLWDEKKRTPVSFYYGWRHKLLRNFVGACHGLEERGLLVHFDNDSRNKPKIEQKTRDAYLITEAGEHVVALLKLSGVYQELAAEFVANDERYRLRRA